MIQKLFKKYIVRRDHGQCQVLIPLIELDDLCDEIVEYIFDYIQALSKAGIDAAKAGRDLNRLIKKMEKS